ncbi:type 1 glutamine amidotransferase [Methanogenium organophilum]|uniref:Gamma-glutamyl-gamma-aminobutyrate hydrolase family protein n=1 Tax=Methanogenium organophilum TaxID=2199 RepID=A0A9X9S4X0_METOG|nr:gamma-glutamyl-gamma-aminobutyrate hydrolase family protein [Methanogenium organophilum]WAI00965.1 gamma-glutamyl-gamma-aminobutyrate hydrolase family protein [Methanogenium organophilum]
MIVLLDLCYRPGSLGEDEFVRPIADIVRNGRYPYKICHFTEWDSAAEDDVDAVILCGTPLKDNLFAEMPEYFAWIPGFTKPVLGICAGMQALVLAYGGSIIEKSEIGMTTVRTLVSGDPIFCENEWAAYELHRFCGVLGREFMVLAESDACVQAVRHRTDRVYGVIFHPEVRNPWVVERFLNLFVSDGRTC